MEDKNNYDVWFKAQITSDITDCSVYKDNGSFAFRLYGYHKGAFMVSGETVFIKREDWRQNPHREFIDGKWQDMEKYSVDVEPERYQYVFYVITADRRSLRIFGLETASKHLRRIGFATKQEIEMVEKGREYIANQMSY